MHNILRQVFLKTMEDCLLSSVVIFQVFWLLFCIGIQVVNEMFHIFCPSTFNHIFGQSPLLGWRHRLLRHCSRCAARRHISPIPVYHLPRIRA